MFKYLKERKRKQNFNVELNHARVQFGMLLFNREQVREDIKRVLLADYLVTLSMTNEKLFVDMSGITMEELEALASDVYKIKDILGTVQHIKFDTPIQCDNVTMTKVSNHDGLYHHVEFNKVL